MANTWGYGAMTNSLGDIQNTKAIIIFGANPAVNHPVGFQHFLKAKERNNAKIIVIDPRFTKTAAKADLYAQIRPGTDIPFMYGMLNIIFGVEFALGAFEMVVDGGFGNAEFLSNFFHYQTLRKQFNDFDSSIRQYRLRGEIRIFMGSNNLCIVSENPLS